jgi:methylenetetrahydromethanopterin dehydrogenase
MTVRVGIVKLGNIGTSRFIDLVLDERADRDVYVRVVGAGAKMGEPEAEEAAKKILDFKPQFCIVISPNCTVPGPTKARDMLKEAGIPTIVISDSPALKIKDDMKAKGFGYFVVKCDPMIGARRQFLDPTEMVLFNADVTKVLAATGVVRLVQKALDEVIAGYAAGQTPALPQIVIDDEKAVAAAGFKNPYAAAKARAAFVMAEKVADVDLKGCFMQKEMEQYIPTVASAHELLRTAARLAEEARELEKATDSILRTPHAADGKVLSKTTLVSKPE